MIMNLMYIDCIIIVWYCSEWFRLHQCYDWVLCSDVMDYCRKVNPLEGSKNGDSLLKKLVC